MSRNTSTSRLSNPDASLDYGTQDAWDLLASRFGATLEARPSGTYGRVECEPGWSWRPRMEDYDLWLVTKGTGSIHINEHTYLLQPGTLVFLRAGDTGMARQELTDRLTVIYVHMDFFVPGTERRVSMDGGWLPSRYIPLQEPARFEVLLARVVRLMSRGRRLDEIEARYTLQLALIEVYRQDAAQHGLAPTQLDPRVERVMEQLRLHPSQRIDLAEAADMAELSMDHFSRLFKQQTGTSFRSYVLRTRIERAHDLLLETDMTVSQIALSLGYDDVYLFSRQFKRFFGYPPSHVRM